jgi:hypothetical protein
VVRAPDDHGATYLADSSLLDLFERARSDMPDWFAAQVDRCSVPDLPPFDPAAALGDVGGDGSGGSRRSRRRRQQTGANGTKQSSAEQRRDHPLSDVWGDR